MEIHVPECRGTTVIPLRGGESGHHVLLVKVAPDGCIPLHTHTVASGMEVIHGSARALGKSLPQRAIVGDYIFKPAGMPHGFDAIGPEGFWFISTAEGSGILHETGWDLAMCQEG